MSGATNSISRVLIIGGALAAGCGAPNSASLSATPTREAVAIRVPGPSGNPVAADAGAGATTAPLGAQATFYTMTVQISTQLNSATATFFDMVDAAVATTPTAHDASGEYWGPFTPALSPMTVELAVHPVDAQDYDFFLGGRAKGADDAAFVGLLGGRAHPVDATHGSGQMEVSFTALHALDPTTHSSTGTIGFVHDNTADPRTVEVHLGNFLDGTPGATPLNATYQYAEHADTSGTFAFALKTNFDHDPQNILEDATLQSRWLPSGAGRADLVASGGSLPTGFVVHATECWDASFSRVFYTEDVDPTKTEGSASACALP